jgi:hypothetical protein
MPSDILPTIDAIFLVIAVLITALASYRAFQVRRAIPGQIYRSRALWTGMVALLIIPYGIFIITGELGVIAGNPNPFSGPPNLVVGVTFAVLSVVDSIIIFFWLDSTIGVAYELDFFHRDTLHWRRFRKLTWALLVIGAFGGGLATNTSQYLIADVFLGIPVSYAAITLAKGVTRIYDETMKRYMKWVGLLVAALVMEIVTVTLNIFLNFPLVAFAYFLYRAAISLSIRNRLEG